jgi:hypothetical protein
MHPWRTVGLAIPWRVASPQSPTPFHQTKMIIARGEENNGNDGCIGPSSGEEEALAWQASLTSPVDRRIPPALP